MDEEVLNLQIRKFLKKVGVTSQREIEKAVREAAAAGTLAEHSRLSAAVHLTCPELGLSIEIEDTIALE